MTTENPLLHEDFPSGLPTTGAWQNFRADLRRRRGVVGRACGELILEVELRQTLQVGWVEAAMESWQSHLAPSRQST